MVGRGGVNEFTGRIFLVFVSTETRLTPFSLNGCSKLSLRTVTITELIGTNFPRVAVQQHNLCPSAALSSRLRLARGDSQRWMARRIEAKGSRCPLGLRKQLHQRAGDRRSQAAEPSQRADDGDKKVVIETTPC
jgi:hypothetical protein